MSNKTIHIVSPSAASHEPLSQHLKEDFGAECLFSSNLSDLSDEGLIKDHLILWDSQGRNFSSFQTWLGSGNYHPPSPIISIFNVDVDLEIEDEAINNGVMGIFYNNDSPQTISKGIASMFSGELWYPRGILSKFTRDHTRSFSSSEDESQGLSGREQEILLLLASGSRNKVIAQKLNLSLSTVKGHISHILKKIDVENRLQATLWAIKNL